MMTQEKQDWTLAQVKQQTAYANEILAQLRMARMVLWSWGARDFTSLRTDQYRCTLQFRVSGRKFKGLVRVNLTGMDTYTVEIGSRRYGEFKARKTLTDLYCDNFITAIDQEIET